MLTKRELQILLLINEGMKNVEIANLLELSIHTVKNHRKSIRNKSGCRNTLALVRWANKEKLL